MSSIEIFAMVVILVFFAIPVFYVWKCKHPSRSLWNWSACFVLIIHGPPLIAGYFSGHLIDVTTQGVGYLFHINQEAPLALARVVLTVLAMSTYIPGVWTTMKIIQEPAEKKEKAPLFALSSANK